MDRAARRPALPKPTEGKSERDRVIEAFMALLADKPIEEIGFNEIAARAGVFFVKQKTAYDISVRDWSSDVCSSDLEPVESWFATTAADVARVPDQEEGS